MPSDIDAARARHVPRYWTDGINPTQATCTCGKPWPCDAALAIAALDDCRAGAVAAVDGYNEACLFVEAERDAARALADELAKRGKPLASRLDAYRNPGDEGSIAALDLWYDALTKWEASRAK